MSKYKSRKVTIDGITFDSKKESERYKELKLLRQAGIISDLELQKRFDFLSDGAGVLIIYFFISLREEIRPHRIKTLLLSSLIDVTIYSALQSYPFFC